MSGEKTAAQLAVDAQPPQDEDEQLEIEDLLGLPETAAVVDLRDKRGRGRPPGARNKRTVEMVRYLLARYADPREILAQMAVARVDELVAMIGCTKLEAWQEKRLAAIALLPYMAQKQPVAIDVTNRRIVNLNITIEEPPTQEDDDDNTISLTARVVEAIEAKE